jgi:diguanylate cyclase (GGDEF)-like protein
MTASGNIAGGSTVAAMAATDATTGRPSLDDIRRMPILVLDEPAGAAALVAMLRQSGFNQASAAHDWDDAIARLHDADRRADGVDLVLLNTSTETFGGYRLCRLMRGHQSWRDTPVIALQPRSGWREDSLAEGLDAGATDLVFLPITAPQDLIPRVVSALLLRRERDIRRRRESELEAELAERMVMEARLQYLVSHDDLTGLANRRRFEQVVEATLAHMREDGESGAIIYIDLDQFKVINDLEGHGAGDRLLMAIANILRTHLHNHETLARISSDEYAVLVANVDRDAAMAVAETLRRTIDDYHFATGEREYGVSASVGVLLIDSGDEITASEALARAAQACFEAKSHGRNLVHLFDANDLETTILREAVGWVPRIREALSNDRFYMVFQPIVELASGDTIAYEALIRMRQPDGTTTEPDVFIPIAERMGLIHEIDQWVVAHALQMVHRLPPALDRISLNVNLSIHAFQDPGLLALARDLLQRYGIPADRITFEITETAAVASYDQTRTMVNELRALGFRFALDDFGTGFSSFNYLKQFPVDFLKIDGSFISNLLDDPIDQHLVRSMVEVGRAFGKCVVAEFVEDEATLDLLREYGVDRAQGNYIGTPLARIPGTP